MMIIDFHVYLRSSKGNRYLCYVKCEHCSNSTHVSKADRDDIVGQCATLHLLH